MTDVIFPQPDDPVELEIRTYKAWLKMPDSMLSAKELKAIARAKLAELGVLPSLPRLRRKRRWSRR
jgi:hypothetical protein